MNALTAFDTYGITALDLADARAVRAVDAWVCAHPGGTPFHRPAWVAAVAKGCRQTALYLVARDGCGEIAGILPLNRIASPLFGRALVSSGFAVDGGILANDGAAAEALAAECWSQATALGCTTAELRGGEIPRLGWTIKADTYLGFSRAIEADTETQMLAVPKRHRAEIRKGLGHDLVVRHGRDTWFRREHYRCYAELVRNLGTPVFPKALFDAMMDGFGDDAEITLVQDKGRTVSAVLTFYHGATCMPYWGGGTAASRALRSNEVMYLRVIDRARERGCKVIDFGRSKVGTGVAAWKKTWGFEPVPMAYAVRAADGQPPRDINPLSPQYARKVALWKKLPLPVANLIGPWLARGLG